jgi:hypothetical protein
VCWCNSLQGVVCVGVIVCTYVVFGLIVCRVCVGVIVCRVCSWCKSSQGVIL